MATFFHVKKMEVVGIIFGYFVWLAFIFMSVSQHHIYQPFEYLGIGKKMHNLDIFVASEKKCTLRKLFIEETATYLKGYDYN